jgi:hypothetical protein
MTQSSISHQLEELGGKGEIVSEPFKAQALANVTGKKKKSGRQLESTPTRRNSADSPLSRTGNVVVLG